MLLPLTVVAATAFGLVAAVAFRMEATTAAFVFTALSIVGWIGLVVEFFLLYDIIIDKWLSKDRSVLTASTLHHWNGLRGTDKIVVASTVEQVCSRQATGC